MFLWRTFAISQTGLPVVFFGNYSEDEEAFSNISSSGFFSFCLSSYGFDLDDAAVPTADDVE